MPKAKYPPHEALNPFFALMMKRLKGLVDGDHYFDTIFRIVANSTYDLKNMWISEVHFFQG